MGSRQKKARQSLYFAREEGIYLSYLGRARHCAPASGETPRKTENMVESSLKTERRDEDETEKNPPKFLKLNSINGATNSLAQVLPVDQTPTPTKIIKLASELFPAETSNNTVNTVTAAKSENAVNSSQPNP